MDEVQVLTIRQATLEDMEYIINNMYPADIEEVKACGWSPYEAVTLSVQKSEQVWVASAPEGAVCIWGVERTTLIGGALGWLLTSNLIDKYSRPFLRQAKSCIVDLHKQYGYIDNYVDSRHTRALRFLEWLGFEIASKGVYVGTQQVPFYKVCLQER